MRTVEWARLRAPELRELAARDAIVIIPIGATEQHGPHLPVMVDHRLVGEVALRAARLIAAHEPALVAPTIPYGMSEHHISLGGTLSLDFATMAAVLRNLCSSAVRQGFRRLFILNGHGGNIAALETIVGELTLEHRLPIGCAAYWQIAAEEIRPLLERQDGVLHACEAESSMIMALEAGDVDAAALPQAHGELVPGASAIPGVAPGIYRWRQLGTRSPNGVVGDASVASAAKGERLLAAITAKVAAALREPALWSTPI